MYVFIQINNIIIHSENTILSMIMKLFLVKNRHTSLTPSHQQSPKEDLGKFVISIHLYMFNNFVISFRIIADKVDTNNDGVISKEELMVWVTHIARRFVVL